MLLHRKEPVILIADIQCGKEVVSTFSLQITSHVDLKQLLRDGNKQVDLYVAMVQVNNHVPKWTILDRQALLWCILVTNMSK